MMRTTSKKARNPPVVTVVNHVIINLFQSRRNTLEKSNVWYGDKHIRVMLVLIAGSNPGCYYRWLITSTALKNVKRNAISFKLFWNKVMFLSTKN